MSTGDQHNGPKFPPMPVLVGPPPENGPHWGATATFRQHQLDEARARIRDLEMIYDAAHRREEEGRELLRRLYSSRQLPPWAAIEVGEFLGEVADP